ncbi:MAG: damage-inducible protein DinB [Planctomycetes bacterium]|nr:damage-inducible protein DinB [Planctomycetota bacterium]
MDPAFLVDSYATERVKTLSVWSQFQDEDLAHRIEPRARTPHEHFVHQCVSEDTWMRTMLGIDVGRPALPERETRVEFLRHYAAASEARLAALRVRDSAWFDGTASFFGVEKSRAWILVRRLTHTAHHRGQLTMLLRELGRALYSTYGPTADTGGLAQNGARVVYRYASVEDLLEAEAEGGAWPALPGAGARPVSERRP